MRPDLAINIFTGKALNNELIKIFGDGEKTRDFTFTDNIIDANLRAMECGSGVYNIGVGERVSINELAERIVAIMGSESEIIYSESVKGDENIPGLMLVRRAGILVMSLRSDWMRN